MTDSSQSKRIAKNTAFLYLRMFISLVVSLYTSRVVLQILGNDNFGVYNVVGGIVVMISIITNTMATTTTRFLSVELGRENGWNFNRVFNTALYIHAILLVIVIFTAETFGLWFLNNIIEIPEESRFAAQWVYQFSIITIVLHIMQSPFTGAIISHERMGVYAYFDLTYVFLKLAIVFLLPFTSVNSLILYGGLLAFVAMIIFTVNCLYCTRKLSGCKISKNIEAPMISEMLKFSGWSLLSSAAFAGKTQGINMILNVYFGVLANTAVGIATQVMSAVENFASNILAAVTPPIMKSMAKGDEKNVVSLTFTSSKLMTILMIFIATPLILETRCIINLWLGEVPIYVVPFTQLTVASLYFTPSYRLFEKCVFATGDIKRLSISNSILLLLILPLSIIAFHFGMPVYTAYVIFVLIAPCLLANDIYLASKYIPSIKISSFLREVVFPCTVVFIFVSLSGYVISFIISSSLMRVILVSIICMIVGSLVAYICALKDNERVIVKKIWSKVTPLKLLSCTRS